jgi:hypothetical protein
LGKYYNLLWINAFQAQDVNSECLAYIWIMYLGALCEHDGWGRMIHRGDRCALSLFQLGLRLLDYLLNEDCTIPVAFYISI